MSNVFDSVMIKRPSYSIFDMSFDHKLSLKMGYLVPVYCEPTVPGDSFRISTNALFRLAAMVAPPMHKVNVHTHTFFVPNRVSWPGWEDFIAPETTDAIPPAFPVLDLTGNETMIASSLGDYMGLPLGVDLVDSLSHGINAIPFSAYQQIYNEYYLDQNSINKEDVILDNGTQSFAKSTNLLKLQKVAWGHDYFTSCAIEPQKGPTVFLPVIIESDPNGIPVTVDNGSLNGIRILDTTGAPIPGIDTFATDGQGDWTGQVGINPAQELTIDPRNTLRVDIDQSNIDIQTTIQDLRTSAAIQRFLEKAMEVGTRYTEVIEGNFGVKSPDARLQRPEYIGGAKSTIAFSEVLQTSQTDTTPLGDMAGHGLSVSAGREGSYYCTEHGFIITLLFIRPETAYYQGLDRIFSAVFDRYQYPWPDFMHLGEESVLNKELFVRPGNEAQNDATFGYLPRYSDYRINSGRVSGQMRTTLNFWHMGREFDSMSPPDLNSTFIECNPTKRIFAVTDPTIDEVTAHIFFDISAKRPLPRFGTPGTII